MLSVLINTHLLMAAKDAGVGDYLFVVGVRLQRREAEDPDVVPLKEEDAYPALPEDGYGWEKLFSERMCRHFREDFGTATRVARYHNVYGPHGTWDGGREKAPAAICRKVRGPSSTAERDRDLGRRAPDAELHVHRRLPVRDQRLMHGDVVDPVNLGSYELVTINQLVDIVEEIAGVKLRRRYNLARRRGSTGATATTP